jgi:predicted unusual protein kinase regulating ubiquinone biosynthesis (AarF/ABC1/UbiB family)
MRAVAVTLLGVSEYTMGRKVGVKNQKLVDHTVRRIRESGVLSIKLAQSIANRKTVILDDLLSASLSEMQCITTYDKTSGLATHQASIAIVSQLSDGSCVKVIRDDSILSDVSDLKKMVTILRMLKLPKVIHETLESLIDEINMSTERQKFLSFSESLKDSDLITVPVVKSSTVSRVVMEYVDSILIKDMPTSIDLDLVNEFFSQVILSAFKSGVFHVDLHAGNVGFKDDRFVIYDMGSVNVVTDSEMQDLWQVLVSSTEHVFFDDWKEVARELLDYKVALKINDPNELKLIVNCITAYSRGEINLDDMMNTFKVIRGGIITSTSISRIFQSIALLEGTCKTMNDDFVPYNAIKLWDILRSSRN